MIKIKNFRTRLSIPIFLSIIFFGLIATTVGSIYVYNNVIINQKNDLILHLKSNSNQVSTALKHIININDDIAEDEDVQSYIIDKTSAFDFEEKITKKLEAYFVNTDVASVSILDISGNNIFSTIKNQKSINYSDRSYFQAALSGDSCVEPYVNIETGQLNYYFSSPVITDDSVTGAIVTEIKPDYIHLYLKLEVLDVDSRIMLSDKNGVILYSSDGEREFHTLGNTSMLSDGISNINKQYNNLILEPLSYDALQEHVISASKDVKVFDFYDQEDKASEILVIKDTGSCPFYIIYEIKKDSFIFSSLKLAFILASIIIVCASMALIIILFVLDRSIKPLKILTAAAKKIGIGNFNVDINVNTHDEFKNLADVIMEMESDLKDIYANLEVKVKEKTADLAKFEMAVASTSEHIVITDPQGIILFANEAVSKITGFSNKEVIGKKAGTKELWGGQMSQDFYKKLWNTICKHKKPFIGVINNKKKDGTQYMASAIISPILDENNEVVYMVATERDITKEVEVDKAKTEFVSLASHQLRTPLSAINWYTEMILNGDAGKVTSEQKKYLDEIYKGNKRMVDLVNSLLNVSRLDLGTFEIDPKPTVIHEVCADVFEEMEHTIKEKKQKLKIHCPNEHLKVNIDPKLMRIIIQNLVSNAVKYTPEKGTISVGLKYNKNDDKHTYIISVSDSGYGIPKDQQPKIFGKLFRADNVRAMDTEGTGLGLYIVKAILDEAGGKISFKSVENQGTTFIVTLPKEGMKQKAGTKKIN